MKGSWSTVGKNNKQEYRKYKQKIIAVRNPLLGTRAFFSSESTETVRRYSRALCHEPFFRNAVIGKCCPDAVTNLGACGNMPILHDFEKSVIWTTLGFSAMAATLNDFFDLRRKFDHAFILGHYEDCLRILDESHNRFGYSLWEMEVYGR